MYAVIRTGGKQYRVVKGGVLDIERLPGDAGDELSFDEVLLVGDEGHTEVGRPLVDGACVKGTILDQKRDKKIVVFKMKRRKTYRRKQGHRQELTRVRIEGIERGAVSPTQAPSDGPPPVPLEA